jgi:hypothetical protein
MDIFTQKTPSIDCGLILNKKTVTNKNIIFNLNGALFNTAENRENKETQSIKLIYEIHIIRLLKDCLNHGNRLFALSNWDQQLYEFIIEIPQIKKILELFDDIVLLKTIGYEPTDPRIFDHLITKHRLDPRHCIVVNDSPLYQTKNSIGIAKNIICTDVNLTKVRQELRYHGAL